MEGRRISHHLPPNKILPHCTNISISQGLRHFTSPSYLNCLNGKGVRQKCLLSYFTHHHPRTMEWLSSALMTTLFTFLTEFGDDDSFYLCPTSAWVSDMMKDAVEKFLPQFSWTSNIRQYFIFSRAR